MAIHRNGITEYAGCVLAEHSHMWLDGMEEIHVDVWDKDAQDIKSIQVGYYGIDGTNLCGTSWELDVTQETARQVVRWLKNKAYKAIADGIAQYKREIRKGSQVEVIKGRKVPKGSKLTVFWVGERETYRSKMYDWMHETEEIAGCWDEQGQKVWIKKDYLKVIDNIKSPNAKERNKAIKAWVALHAREYNIRVKGV